MGKTKKHIRPQDWTSLLDDFMKAGKKGGHAQIQRAILRAKTFDNNNGTSLVKSLARLSDMKASEVKACIDRTPNGYSGRLQDAFTTIAEDLGSIVGKPTRHSKPSSQREQLRPPVAKREPLG